MLDLESARVCFGETTASKARAGATCAAGALPLPCDMGYLAGLTHEIAALNQPALEAVFQFG